MNRNATHTRTDHAQSARGVFRVPVWLGLASIVGLLSALFGDGAWDGLSWLTMLAPVAAVCWAWGRRLTPARGAGRQP
ncbi:hypothetical protein CAL18_17415 [Bordetella genomosp. 7]|uniref:hypothetical protein n=1 Tax=Bordetella genomosp. 7 TaxID=1416805 RepID=UPI000B9EA996|nr:hypothetical protein [Bordetella genomosp. 7]OZI15753.1 hypothetical protein CAL18_17415 [Bordetella genomosp. 7]